MDIKNIYSLPSDASIHTFHDPSVDKQYHLYTPQNRDIVVPYDTLLAPFILQLNREVFADIPEGLSESQKDLWIQDKIGDLFIRILDNIRIHGWCVVIYYEQNENYLVLSESQRTSWVYETVNGQSNTPISSDNKPPKRIGAKMIWTSDDGLVYNDTVLFEDDGVLFIYWELNNMKPQPDLIPAIWTLASQARVASDMLMLGLARPVFFYAKYGDTITPDIQEKIEEVLNDGYSMGLGATSGVLEDFSIAPIPISDQILPSLDQIRKQFAGVTHLPLSYFNGERTSNGLSDAGEKVGEMQIRSAKNRIFSRIKPYIVEFMSKFYSETIDPSELELDAGDVTEDEMESDNKTEKPIPQKQTGDDSENGQ